MPLDYTRPLAVDLFAGAGGLSLGLEQAGYEIAAAVEYDPIHAAVHEYNFPYGQTFARDVTGITGAEIRSESGIGKREIALVAGGPPCQGISLIGRRALDDPRNALLKEYVRLVLELQPRHFLMENVAGLTVGKHRQLLTEVIDLLSDGGYQVLTPYRVLQAADYGTPQSRKRLILLGARADVPLPHYPEPAFTPRPIRNRPLPADPELPLGPSVDDALGDIPDAHSINALLDGDCATAVDYGVPSHYAAELRGITMAADDFSHPRRFDRSMLTSSNRTNHTSRSIERFEATMPGDVEPVSRFLRLNPEGICNTLRAGTASDRGPSPHLGRFIRRILASSLSEKRHVFTDTPTGSDSTSRSGMVSARSVIRCPRGLDASSALPSYRRTTSPPRVARLSTWATPICCL